jgi:hypothetical protein
MPVGTAFSNTLESEVLNSTLRGAAFTAKGGATMYLAFLTNATSDTALTELASGGAYTTRPAFTATTSQCFSTATGSDIASTSGTQLLNRNALTFTASGAANNSITGIAICTTNTVNATPANMATDASVLYYGDLTGGTVSLAVGQSITFAAGAITVSLD